MFLETIIQKQWNKHSHSTLMPFLHCTRMIYSLTFSLFLTGIAGCESRPPATAPVPAVQQSGCLTDYDCKSGRVCLEGKCAYPVEHKDTGYLDLDSGFPDSGKVIHYYDAGSYADAGSALPDSSLKYDTVETPCVDNDHDGFYVGVGCRTANDCDDTRSDINPQALEICDNIDNNCDGQVDVDCPCSIGDTLPCGSSNLGECHYGTQRCDVFGHWNNCEGNIEPTPELCDGLDNNCNGLIDEGQLTTFYQDRDGDGYGSSLFPIESCQAPRGYVINHTDCNDNDFVIHPAAEELCDLVDNNCNNTIDEGCACVAGQTHLCGTSNIGECQYGQETCDPHGEWGNCVGNVEPQIEVYDGLDNNCDGETDEGLCQPNLVERCGSTDVGACEFGERACDARGQWLNCMGNIEPIPELCDTIDNNCNGLTDEGGICNPILFISNRDQAGWGIYVMDANGENQHLLRIIPDAWLNNPMWSPNKSKIVYQADSNIYLMDAQGRNPVQLIAGDSPSWSPDGTEIAYSNNWNINIMNNDGRNNHSITNDANIDTTPTWSPDGRKIVFSRGWNIYVMDKDGRNIAQLTNDNTRNFLPSWSPDGTKIAYTSGSQIYIMNSDGRNQHGLTND